jgi:hypothetical protein
MLVNSDRRFPQIVVALLETHHRDYLDIVSTARRSEECIIQPQVLAPEILLMDLTMPGLQMVFKVTALAANDLVAVAAFLGTVWTEIIKLFKRRQVERHGDPEEQSPSCYSLLRNRTLSFFGSCSTRREPE